MFIFIKRCIYLNFLLVCNDSTFLSTFIDCKSNKLTEKSEEAVARYYSFFDRATLLTQPEIILVDD